jgi:hypothetical protein
LKDCSERLEAAREAAQLAGDCVMLTQSFSGSIQTGVIKQFEDLLTRAIRQIFGRDYSIIIEFQNKGNSLWADFLVKLPSGRLVSISNGEGGGMKDLVGVLNRILYLVIDPTQPARIVFMDENMADMDEWRSPFSFQFLVRVMRELGIQCVWITHNESVSSGDLVIDNAKIYKLAIENDRTVTELLRTNGPTPQPA